MNTLYKVFLSKGHNLHFYKSIIRACKEYMARLVLLITIWLSLDSSSKCSQCECQSEWRSVSLNYFSVTFPKCYVRDKICFSSTTKFWNYLHGEQFLWISTGNYMFGRAIRDKLPEYIFENFETARVKRRCEPNMWLLVNHTKPINTLHWN